MRMSILTAIGALMVAALCVHAEQDAASTGRYVHISLAGSATLSLAEVQVFSGGENVARKRPTRQRSTAYGGDASRAVDGNTSGVWSQRSITHTTEEAENPAWEVDLGKELAIEKISLWNRDGYISRLDNATIRLLKSDRSVVWGTKSGAAKRGENALDVRAAGNLKQLGSRIPEVTLSKSKPSPPKPKPSPPKPKSPKPNPYKSNDYRVTPEENSGVLNGPLMNRKRPEKKDPRLALRQAIEDLIATHGAKYPEGKRFLTELESMPSADDPAFEGLKRRALLANPLFDFDKILLVKRKGTSMPANWQGNSSIKDKQRTPDNELVTLSLKSGELTTIYKPAKAAYVGQFDLHFDADKILFSSIAAAGNWGVFEIQIDPATGALTTNSLRQVSPEMGTDVDSYDPVYLPNEKIIFVCSSGYSGVPCVGGKDYVGNLHIMGADGSAVRRLAFDQDNDWNPVMMPNGRVMYLRWEYTDSAHYFSRVMMYMNQDGTDQKGYYGSNSYWPNSMFFPQPVPGTSSKFVAIVGSHHGAKRSGALVLFDAAKGRQEADGAMQIIGESGQAVEPVVHDRLGQQYRPHYLTPYPLSDKYFLASINSGGWKLCLVDIFDNLLILKDAPGWCLLEPVPLKRRVRPPVMPDRVRLDQKEATLWISDVHFGPGLKGVPKGTAKALRIYRYEYSPRNSGGHYAMGMETCWDARTLLGTVPLEADGSVMVKIPANTPISIQPLDAEGKALQLMRSWTVAQPGEVLSCIGCHESPNAPPPPRPAMAARKAPQELTPWHGAARGFSYTREVQPTLDTYCIGCHTPANARQPQVAQLIKASTGRIGTGPNTGKRFREAGIPDLSTPGKSHANLHPYVRRNGPEGDYHLLTPLEFHADTSELVQMLAKGHHNVELDQEGWDRIITWIDLSAPYHGTWTEARGRPEKIARRLELRKLYANVDFDPEAILNPYTQQTKAFTMPAPLPAAPATDAIEGWPFDADEAAKRQGEAAPMALDLGDGVTMPLVRIPAGAFLMGSTNETPMEMPMSAVTVPRPFWMATTEVTLAQYRQFEASYLNGVYDMHHKDQVKRGYYMNDMRFPVIRVTWEKANAFCNWLSKESGKKVRLPSEDQWEWACRAGSGDAFSYGGPDTDFGTHANLADVTRREMAVRGVDPHPMNNPHPTDDFELKDNRFYDKTLHLAPVGTYQPNAWGLFDMHGNVAEWTDSPYTPYPFKATGSPSETSSKRVVRGGSWSDRPHRSTSSYRLGFPQWQRLYNVGFRVIIED